MLVDKFIRLIVVLTFVVSPGVMYLLGISYSSQTGGVIEKIHISTFLSFALIVVMAVFSGKFTLRTARFSEIVFLFLIYSVALVQMIYLGNPVTSILVTLFTSLFMIFLICASDRRNIDRLEGLVLSIILCNSVIGLLELFNGSSFLPTVAGNVVVQAESRAIGIIGHPLTSSFVTGMALLYLVISRMMTRFDYWSVIQICIHAAAMLVFGGRVALTAVIVLLSFYALFDGSTVVRKHPLVKGLRRFAFIIGAFGLGGAIVGLGIADNALARFVEDNGSAVTRFVALDIITQLSPQQLAIGVTSAERSALMSAYGTEFGIEVTWIAWLVDYGFFTTLALMAALYVTIRICLRGAGRYHYYMAAFFLICMTGSQGLGSKTLYLTWFVIMMLTFGRSDYGAKRRTQNVDENSRIAGSRILQPVGLRSTTAPG